MFCFQQKVVKSRSVVSEIKLSVEDSRKSSGDLPAALTGPSGPPAAWVSRCSSESDRSIFLKFHLGKNALPGFRSEWFYITQITSDLTHTKGSYFEGENNKFPIKPLGVFPLGNFSTTFSTNIKKATTKKTIYYFEELVDWCNSNSVHHLFRIF